MTKANGIQGTTLPHASPMLSVTHSPVARPSATVIVGALPSKSSDLLADLDFFTAAPPVVTSTANATSFPSPRSKSTVNAAIPQSASQPSFANFNNADFFFSGNYINIESFLSAVTDMEITRNKSFFSPAIMECKQFICVRRLW